VGTLPTGLLAKNKVLGLLQVYCGDVDPLNYVWNSTTNTNVAATGNLVLDRAILIATYLTSSSDKTAVRVKLVDKFPKGAEKASNCSPWRRFAATIYAKYQQIAGGGRRRRSQSQVRGKEDGKKIGKRVSLEVIIFISYFIVRATTKAIQPHLARYIFGR